jgi:hypothetical protein
VPIVLCVLHLSLASFGLVGILYQARHSPTETLASISHPLVLLQPLCSMVAAWTLYCQRRSAVLPMLVLTAVVIINPIRHGNPLPWFYVAPVVALTAYVIGLAFARKLR